jgi:hypothetical protein
MHGLTKLGFVRGWLECGSLIYTAIPSAFAFRILKDCPSREAGKPIITKLIRIASGFQKESGLEFSGLTLGQVVDTIDKVYSDPRVKNWEIYTIMPLVRGRLKEGWTEKDLDEVIAYQIKYNELQRKREDISSMPDKSKWENYQKEQDILFKNEPKVLKALQSYEWE